MRYFLLDVFGFRKYRIYLGFCSYRFHGLKRGDWSSLL